MMKTFLLPTCILLIASAHLVHCDTGGKRECRNSETCKNEKNNEEANQCELYLAESSIPGAGMGLYSGVTIPKNGRISTPDIAIPLLNTEDSDQRMIKRYTWQGAVYGMYFEARLVDTFAPGAFALCNGHQGLHNIFMANDIDSDNLDIDRHNSPGSGAFTPWFKLQGYATTEIKQGQELFASYG